MIVPTNQVLIPQILVPSVNNKVQEKSSTKPNFKSVISDNKLTAISVGIVALSLSVLYALSQHKNTNEVHKSNYDLKQQELTLIMKEKELQTYKDLYAQHNTLLAPLAAHDIKKAFDLAKECITHPNKNGCEGVDKIAFEILFDANLAAGLDIADLCKQVNNLNCLNSIQNLGFEV